MPELFYFFSDGAIKAVCALQCHAEVYPLINIVNLVSIEGDVVQNFDSFAEVEIFRLFCIETNVPLCTIVSTYSEKVI